MEPNNQEEIIPTLTSEVTPEVTTPVVTEDPIKAELEKVKRKGEGRTELEKLTYTKTKILEREKELLAEQGITHEDNVDDDAPITRGELKKIQAQQAEKTAVQMADSISNESERELTLYYLKNRIQPTGNPEEDFQLAQSLTNSVRNKQIMDQANLKPEVKTHSSAQSTPVNTVQSTDNVQLTRHEMDVLQAGILTKEEILKARKAPLEFKDFSSRVVVNQ